MEENSTGDKWSYTDELDPNAGERRNVRALRHEQLDVHFQPIVQLSSGALFAYEALVRCKVQKYRSPIALFRAAEAERCCGRLGRLIRDVCFARCTDTSLFVNLHPHELRERWLVRPDDPIGFHGAEVFLEVTEAAAFDDTKLTFRVLKDVCSRVDAHLVVDDLGAGHADIFRVLDLEPDVVKLDRALVEGLDTDPAKQRRLDYFVDLCTELGSLVVVEGVETVDELKAVRDTGAPYVQGFLIAKPSFPPPAIKFDPEWSSGPQSRRPGRPHATPIR